MANLNAKHFRRRELMIIQDIETTVLSLPHLPGFQDATIRHISKGRSSVSSMCTPIRGWWDWDWAEASPQRAR